ncbi:MAG: CHAT domain-containing protein [Cyanobacteria bacterium P01_A01_bin.15]
MRFLLPNLKRRSRRVLLSALFSFLVTLGVPVLLAQGGRATPVPSSPVIAQTSTAESLLQMGIQLYEAEQFTAAIDIWQRSLTDLEVSQGNLTQALLYNNISLAYQHLGRWDQAKEAISQSLNLLENVATPSAEYLETLGKALNTQGRLQWAKGDLGAALAAWREATAAYQQAGHTRGILLSLLNQAKALQAQGLHFQSQSILEQDVAQMLQNEQLDPMLRATGLWHLGNAQKQFGALSAAKANLQSSLDIIGERQLASLKGAVLLELGNTERALGDSASAIGKVEQAQTERDDALGFYLEAAISASNPIIQLQAQLNRLSLFIELGQGSEANALWPTLLPKIAQLSPSRTAVYAQLNFAKSLTKLMPGKQSKPAADQQVSATAPDWTDIDRLLNRAIGQAQTLEDPIAESYGIGQRGELYEITQQWSQAQELTLQALQLTEPARYLDGRYRWEWQLGRLLKQTGKQDEAIQAYSAAVKTLELVRNDLLFIDAEVQFSFRDNIEPVYRELVDLLVSSRDGNGDPSQENLERAIQQIDNLQLSELENFLRCNLSQTTAITKFKADSTAAILYPIILEDRLAVILQLPGTKKFAQIEISKSEVNATLQQLRRDLSNAPNRTPEVIAAAKEVYRWLIEPFALELQQSDQIETLVFVLDGSLRNIPMAVLHDGDDYLIKRYAIAVAPQLDLFTPSPLTQELQVFTGGMGRPQKIEGREFSKIEKLEAELDGISQLSGTQPPLLNQNFTKETLQQQLRTGDFSGIHIKTHGLFSSDPEETFIVAHDELIRGQALGDLIQAGSRQGETPIELLVLSACSTAEGDNRAVLGLAGIAVRAGARSTISTLWEAQDVPNTQLMIQFYRELKIPGTTRAQALRRAQLNLLESGYRAPHIWSTYVLVGNWL